MPDWLMVIILAVGAYLLGAVPVGVLVGRLHGVDITNTGSGNVGATNIARVVGRPWGVLVFLLDVFKGMGPMILARSLLSTASLPASVRNACWLAVGVCAIIGHNHSVYLGFRGGKGVSTTLGVLLGVYPDMTLALLCTLGLWVLTLAVWRFVSLASVAAAVSLPGWYLLWIWRAGRTISDQWIFLTFSLVAGAMVVVRHRANLVRLMAGREHKIGGK